VRFCGVSLNVPHIDGLFQHTVIEDSHVHWYLKLQVMVPKFCGPVLPSQAAIRDIDLGLKTAST
jgi:hypothetical protein